MLRKHSTNVLTHHAVWYEDHIVIYQLVVTAAQNRSYLALLPRRSQSDYQLILKRLEVLVVEKEQA